MAIKSEEDELARPWTRAASAVLLDRSLSPIQRIDNYAVRTDVCLRFNLYGPHIEVVVRLARSNGETLVKDSGSLAGLPDGFDKAVSIRITRSLLTCTSILPLTNEAYSTHDLLEQREIDEMPSATKEEVEKMKAGRLGSVPILFQIDCPESATLTSNLNTNRPQWIEALLTHGLRRTSLRLLVDGDEEILECMRVLSYILRFGDDPLLRFQKPGLDGRSSFDKSAFMKLPVANLEFQSRIGYKVTYLFVSPEEYVKIYLAAAILDRMDELAKVQAYERNLKKLVLVQCSEDEYDNQFYGFIDAPSPQQSFRLRVGDCLDIDFTGSGGGAWRGVVTAPLPMWRARMIPLLVYRPLPEVTRGADGKTSYVSDSYEPSCINPNGMANHLLREAITTDDGNGVRVTVVGIGNVLDSICEAYGSMMSPNETVGHEHIAFRKRIIDVLTCRRPDKLPFKDLYEHVKNHQPGVNIFEHMGVLNEQQLEAVVSSRKLLGGVKIIQGPPGTGKTYAMLQMIVAFLVSLRHTVVLVSTPTNHGADDLAKALCQLLEALKKNPKLTVLLKKRFVLRLHSEIAEMAIMRTQGPEARKRKPKRKPTSTAAKQSKPRGMAVEMLERFRVADTCKFPGVRDKRVQEIEYSAGYMMLCISGIVPNTAYQATDERKWARFRRLYEKRYVKRQDLDGKEEDKALELDTAALYEAALAGASVIVSTTSGIGSKHCLPYVEHNVSAIFLDENAHEREDSLAPIFAGKFRLDPCIVVVGDQEQLAPSVNDVPNAFKEQLAMSWMQRLINNGMDHTMLIEQHRMVPDIALPPSTLSYGGKLINASSTALSERPAARWFRGGAATPESGSNRFMFNVTPSALNTTNNKKKSKYNNYFVSLTSTIIVSLLKGLKGSCTIAVLTPYSEQKGSYVRMVSNMKEKKLEHADKITVDTFDGAQGRQFDFVIIDLPVDHSVGFLGDHRRMNVALTRARNGLIIICDQEMIRKAMRRTTYLMKLLSMFDECTQTIQAPTVWPSKEWFDPVEVRRDEEDSDE